MARERINWIGLPIMATLARLLCRELTLQNECLRTESAVLEFKVNGRIRFTNDERHSLVGTALTMGRDSMRQVVSIVEADTILAGQRRLERKKWDYSRRPGRPRKSPDRATAYSHTTSSAERDSGLGAVSGTSSAQFRTTQASSAIVLSPMNLGMPAFWAK